MAKQQFLSACAFTVLACGIATPAAAQVGSAAPPQTVAGQERDAQVEQTVAQDAPIAQTQGSQTLGDPQDAGADQADIVVTGSLIAGSPEDSAVPIDVISGEELARQGSPSAVDLLKNLPTSNGVIGDANQFDSRSQGNEGVASVNLRGLGPQRTLVLLNGDRVVQSAGGIPIVDINLIPSAAIGRVEILKDGAAATYGSDAIAGVVNFITRTDQRGFLAQGDYRYIDGSDGDYGGSISWGGGNDRFRMLASFGYQHRSELRTTDRDFVVQPYANNPQGGYTGGGNPGNFGFAGAPVFTRDLGCESLGGFRSLPGSATDRCFNNYGQFGNLVEPENRYQAYVDFSADITDNAVFSATALFGSSTTRITTSPTYLPTLPPSLGAAGSNGATFVIPGYSPAVRDYCQTYGAAAGCAFTPGATNPNSVLGFPVLFRPALLGGNPVFLGGDDGNNDRGSAFSRRDSESIRFTADLKIDLTDSIDFNTGFTFSQYVRDFEGTDTFGDLFQNALAGFGGANCPFASTASRAGLTPVQLASIAGTQGCTFFNPFSTAVFVNPVTGQVNPNYAGSRPVALGLNTAPGAGLINDVATFDNFFRTTRTVADTQLFVGDAVLSGRTGITLPGGEIGFAIGAQYRKDYYKRFYNDDSNLAINPCPNSPLNPAATCAQRTGALGFLGTNLNGDSVSDVYALFAELQVPIIDAINIQLSARYENYGGNVGSTFDPQGRIKFQVTDWLALRGGAGTTFRGPPAQQLEGNLTVLQIIGTSFRAVDINGNPNLAPESATTYNAGLIIEGGGFNFSLDYFKYDLEGPIEGEPIAGIVGALFGANGMANCGNAAFTELQRRFTFNGGVCNIANVGRLRTQVVNSANVSTSGLDLQTSFRANIGAGSATLGVAGTYVIDYITDDVTVEGVVVQPAYDAVGLLNYQTTAYPIPEFKGSAYIQGDFGAHSLRVQFNYLDGYTDQRTGAIFGPNPGALAGASVTAGKEIGAFKTLDATYRLILGTGTTLALSALNILDEDPPFARLDQNYDPFTASPLGFTAKASLSQKF